MEIAQSPWYCGIGGSLEGWGGGPKDVEWTGGGLQVGRWVVERGAGWPGVAGLRDGDDRQEGILGRILAG